MTRRTELDLKIDFQKSFSEQGIRTSHLKEKISTTKKEFGLSPIYLLVINLPVFFSHMSHKKREGGVWGTDFLIWTLEVPAHLKGILRFDKLVSDVTLVAVVQPNLSQRSSSSSSLSCSSPILHTRSLSACSSFIYIIKNTKKALLSPYSLSPISYSLFVN